MRKTSTLACLLLVLLLVGCGGKDKKASNDNGNPNNTPIPPNTKLVKLELPGMT